MSHNIVPLDPLRFPLTGSHLIEASAGTGKTFTIAMLYVRLVLGHGNEHTAFCRALTPPEILVVTFTDAATKELRDRIRARLAEAATYFRADPASITQPTQPDLLHDLRAEYTADDWPACARKLELAAEWMDEAAVSTIHGWCNRMLREHAFDSQSLFNLDLETDQTELRSEIVRDYWRTFFYPLDAEATATVLDRWKTPNDLEEEAGRLLKHANQLADPEEPAAVIRAAFDEKRQKLEALKKPWATWADEVLELLNKAKGDKLLDGKKLQPRFYEAWLDSLRQWATSAEETLELSDTAWRRLSPDGIKESWKEGNSPDHPAFAEIPILRAALSELPDPSNRVLSHAVRWIAKTFDATQKQRARIGFDELLTGLESALSGPHGDRLADVIRRQFPVALIDEFQDTDPVQYRIFERIYDIASNRPDCALILIGDPKQAIYAFRGADIYTYLNARDAVSGRLYTLGTNFRSTQAMVDAANHCFTDAEQRTGSAGAFRFRTDDDNPVPFHAVKAHGRKDEFRVEGQTPPAMTIAVLVPDDGATSKTKYIEQMARVCATQIVAWLNLGARGKAGFGPAGEVLEPLRPGNIAVLVNNGNEATAIRTALSRRGVRSVYLSDKDTVYATREATEILRWLCACAEPDDDRLLRAALSTTTLGLSFADLDTLNIDEEAWESRVVQFKGYREVWRNQGVLPMLRRILGDFGCSERLLDLAADSSGNSGERILTDILHLAELLQRASFALEGEHALIRFLAEQIAAPEEAAESIQLRLESDADLVKVITIHKSKGLEYPLVFLPFVCATRATKTSDLPLKWHDEQRKLRISLEADERILSLADADRLGEDLRKVYVALTRAQYLTWLGLAPIKDNEASAIGHLFGLSNVEASQYLDKVTAFAGQNAFLSVTHDLPVTSDAFLPATPTAKPGAACRPGRPATDHWWISSYSALRVEGHSIPGTLSTEDTPQAANLIESGHDALPLQTPRQTKDPMHRFFKGAEAGTFLHDLMEWIANAGFSTALADRAGLRDMIARRCRVRRWEAWVEPLLAWVERMLTTPLPLGAEAAKGCCLYDVTIAKAEMEFWFEIHDVDLTQLDRMVIEHTLEQRPRPPLAPESINGMLKGFMDLVFEHEGRYYVADYKSNWLGPTDEDYTAEAMDEAIRSHRYDLQYVIYLFALHRLLRSRLPDYDYDRHVGGAAYLFVRGINAKTAGVHFERPPKKLMEILDEMFAGSARRAA